MLPLRSEQRILDVTLLFALDLVGPGLVKRAHEPQTRLLHHASRPDVHRHRGREHPSNAEVRETFVDQRARALGRVALPPDRFAQPVTELDLVGVDAFHRPKMELTHKSPGRLLDGRPEAISGEALVELEEHREDVALDLVARRRPT